MAYRLVPSAIDITTSTHIAEILWNQTSVFLACKLRPPDVNIRMPVASIEIWQAEAWIFIAYELISSDIDT